jgi:hypothetical protein
MSIPAQTLAADFRRSGKTQQDFCTAHNISIHTLRYYLYKKPRREPSTFSRSVQPDSAGTAPLPSFISFNRGTLPENISRHPVTIIQGFFSTSEAIEILSSAAPRQ